MEALRLFLHVLAASVWVGGQLVLLGVLPAARQLGEDAPRRLAVAFRRIAWPAFTVTVVTGLWNLVLIPLDQLAHPWIELKVLAVTLSGIGAAVHQVAKGNRLLLAAGGATSTLFAVAAMYLGFLVGPTG
jgi:hypothetical protein